ncbi:MAG: DUF2589 domain-containing protein [Dysgonomonas sp.]
MSIFHKNKPEETHSFDDIIKGFQYAVNSAQEMLATQQLEMFLKYFESDGKPITQTIVTPMNQEVQIPLVTLVPQHTLAIDEVSINFTTRINRVSAQSLQGTILQGSNTPSVEHVGLEMDISSTKANSGDLVRVSIKFKSVQQPEGVARIIDEQNKRF